MSLFDQTKRRAEMKKVNVDGEIVTVKLAFYNNYTWIFEHEKHDSNKLHISLRPTDDGKFLCSGTTKGFHIHSLKNPEKAVRHALILIAYNGGKNKTTMIRSDELNETISAVSETVKSSWWERMRVWMGFWW